MTRLELPPDQFLTECFTYDPQTGEIFWKERPRSHFSCNRGWNLFNVKFAGRNAGCEHYDVAGVPAGIRIGMQINGKFRSMYAHRIIFVLMGVAVPDGFDVDHKDTNPYNNAWDNLRLATKAQNARNRKGWKHRKTQLPKGVLISGNKFGAQMRIDGVQTFLGSFATPELAHAAYCAKAAELHGEFARFN